MSEKISLDSSDILLITPIRYHRIIIFFVPKMLVSLSLICLAIMEKILKLS